MKSVAQRRLIKGMAAAAVTLGSLLAMSPAEAGRSTAFKGPVEASVVEIIDGDTFLAEAHVWPGHFVTVNIRIRGIDAPEMKSRCEKERDAALRARAELASLIEDGPIRLTNIGGAKYYGRVLAEVATKDGLSVGQALLARALVRPYSGGRRDSWCG